MHVVALWRHPVKSLQGERVDAALVTPDGLAGDRSWAVRDRASGAVLSAKREPRLLLAAARTEGEGVVVVLPDGAEHPAGPGADAALSDWIGRPVVLDPLPRRGPGHVDAEPLHLLSTGALAALGAAHPDGVWDARRFRPNVVVDAGVLDGGSHPEDAWCGAPVRLGGVAVEVSRRTYRCSMTSSAQPGLPKDLGILRTLAAARAVELGVYARAVAAGRVAVGDPVLAPL